MVCIESYWNRTKTSKHHFKFLSCTFGQLWHAAELKDISRGNHSPKSKTVMPPIIDLNPTNETCIYSTLLFVIEQSMYMVRYCCTTCHFQSAVSDYRSWHRYCQAIEYSTLTWRFSHAFVLLWQFCKHYGWIRDFWKTCSSDKVARTRLTSKHTQVREKGCQHWVNTRTLHER